MTEEDDTRAKALAAARRAVQFLESGQATGIFIVLTDEERALMWDAYISPHPHPMGDAALVLTEAGARLRRAWYSLIVNSGEDGNFLAAIDEDEAPE
jgi:hypothetical protein